MKTGKMRAVYTILMAVTAVAVLTACASTSGADSTVTAIAGTTVYGKVTKADGNQITIAVGTSNMPQGTPGDGQQQGTPPTGGNGQQQGTPPTGENGQGPQGTPPTDGNGQQPQGTPLTGGNGAEMLTLTGEEKTITVTNESIISVPDGNEASGLAAITVDQIIRIDYDDNQSITSIRIMGGNQRPSSTASPSATTTG